MRRQLEGVRVGREREVGRLEVGPRPWLRGRVTRATVHEDAAVSRWLEDLGRDGPAVVEVREPLRQLLERRTGRRVGRGPDIDAQRIDGDGLLEAAGVEGEGRRSRVRDVIVRVGGLGDPEIALADRHLERRLDLFLGELRGAERAVPEDGADRRRTVRGGVAEDHGAIAVEREDRRLARQEARHHEPAALVVAQEDVRGARRVLDGSERPRAGAW